MGAVALAGLAIAGLGTVWYTTYTAPTAITPRAIIPPAKTPVAHRINERTVQEIHEGMTPAEVETLLGAPPGDYRTRPVKIVDALASSVWKDEIWTSDEAHVRVAFSDNGRVVSVRHGSVLPPE